MRPTLKLALAFSAFLSFFTLFLSSLWILQGLGFVTLVAIALYVRDYRRR